jgi:hypothetical protein
VVVAVEKFHQYVYGRDFIVQNDHKPLQFLFKKSLASCPPRVQRMMLRQQKYSFDYQWIPGKELLIADALSRAQLLMEPSDAELHRELDFQVHMITSTLPFSENKLKLFSQEVEKDPTLSQLKSVIRSGWPDEKKDVPFAVRQYWMFRDELTIHDNLIFRGERVMIPGEFQREMLSRIHEGHLGSANVSIALALQCTGKE